MTPKLWPKRLIYAKEPLAPEMHLCILRNYLCTGNPEDLQKSSWIIENKCVHPHLQIKKITSSTHPLSNKKILNGHLNYGIFATEKINTGTEIGEYVGEIHLTTEKESIRTSFSKNPTSEYKWCIKVNNLCLTVDAQNIANELALINDFRDLRPTPNVKMTSIVHKGCHYFGYVTICDIEKGEELLVDYGEMFWKAIQKKRQLN